MIAAGTYTPFEHGLSTHASGCFLNGYFREKEMIYISPNIVRSKFKYHPETGIINRLKGSKEIKTGTVDLSGVKNSPREYIRIHYEGKRIYAHRLVWVYVTGEQPDEVDHIDGDGLNNRWSNLRNVSHIVNSHNQKIHTTNTSGSSGVTYRKDSCKWRARIMLDGKMIQLGNFVRKQDAIKARNEAEKTYYEHRH